MINREIDYVMTIAETGSLLKASEKLFISSSALSKYIQNLEARLNVQLFDRVGKRFVLTYAGERYLFWIKKEQALLREMENELTDISNSIRGTLRVGISTGFTEFWIRNALADFHKQYPQIKVEIVEEISTTIRQLISDNLLDFAIIEEDDSDPVIQNTPLFEETIILAVSDSNKRLRKAAKKKKGHKYPWLSRSACNDVPFVMPRENQKITMFVETSYGATLELLDPIVTAKNVQSLLSCVSSGIGITVTTDFAVYLSGFFDDNISLYSLGKKELTRKWSIATHKDHYLPEHARVLIDLSVNAYSTLAETLSEHQVSEH